MDAAKILIAEDESIIALDIKNILEKRGFNIIGIAYSGKESISLAEKHTPDIVLMDIILEGEIDGITAAEEIKARYDIPIIYLTAHSDENTLNRAKATEPYGYILKPLNENEMYSTLVTALYKHELEMKLKESEIRYRTLFQNAKNGVAIFQAVNNGEDFVFVDINSAGEQIDRLKREKTIGKSILEVFSGIREFGLFDIIQNVWRTGNPKNYPPARYEDDRISGWRENYVYKLPSGEIIIIYDDITEKKQTEDALRQSEEKYRLVVENANEGIVIIQNGAIKFSNDKAIKIIGYSIGELERTPFFEMVHPDDRELAMEYHSKRIEGKEVPELYEMRILDKNNQIKWLQMSVVRIEWEQEPAALAFMTDITIRKRSEEELRESKDKYRSLVENINEAIFSIDMNGIITYVSPVIKQIAGYTSDNLVGKHFNQFIHTDDLPGLMESYERTIAGNYEPYEYRLVLKDGSSRYIRSNSRLIIEDGEKRGLIGVITDIHNRVLAEHALRESEAKFRALTESIPAAIFIVQDGTFRYVNPAFEAVSGYLFEEIEGKSYLDIIHPDFRELVKLTNEGRMKGDTVPSRYGFKIVTKNGTEKWIDNSATVILYENRPAVLGSAFDITEQKRAEDELRVTGEKFSKAFFSSPAMMNISHYKEGRYLDVNESVLKHTGYSSEEIVGKTIAELDIFPNKEQLSRYIETLKRDGKVKDFEIDYRTKSGEIRTEIVSAEAFRMEGVKYLLGSSIDITERKRAEEKIREQYEEIQGQYEELEAINEELTSIHNELIEANEKLTEEKERLSFTLRSIVEGVITTDSQGRVNLINSAAENITGWKQSEAEGKLISDVLIFTNEQPGQSYDNAISSILNNGKVVELKQGITITARDGTLRSIAASGSPIRDMQKKIIGIIMVIRDLTEREQ
jgi:PAS domain S-box-containing protein